MNKQAISKLKKNWSEAGINTGDTILLHSNITRTIIEFACRGMKIGIPDIFESLRQLIGEDGMLIIPTFNFDFCEGKVFDIQETTSQVGSLTEYARTHPDAIRSMHPVYSFALFGNPAMSYAGLDNEDGFGNDSPFGILYQRNGKIALLDHWTSTFHHYIENMNKDKVNYRYYKAFSGQYIDNNRKKSERTYGFLVRDFDMQVETLLSPAEDLLWKKKLYMGCHSGERHGISVINARSVFDFISNEVIIPGKAEGILYKIKGNNTHERQPRGL